MYCYRLGSLYFYNGIVRGLDRLFFRYILYKCLVYWLVLGYYMYLNRYSLRLDILFLRKGYWRERMGMIRWFRLSFYLL